MALRSKKLKMVYDDGMVDGKQRRKTKTYSNINLGALDENLKQVSGLIGGLQKKGLLESVKVEETLL